MAAKKKTEPVVEKAPEVTPIVEHEFFYDEIAIPQELAEQLKVEEKVEVEVVAEVKVEPTHNPIVRILQKTPSGFNVLRADGTREKLTKAQYRAEVG